MLRKAGLLTQREQRLLCPDRGAMRLADVLTESALGVFGVPLGLVEGMLVDGKIFHVPLATEEASVLRACSYAARIVARNGGFTTQAPRPEIRGQIVMERVPPAFHELPEAFHEEFRERVGELVVNMERRGGGMRRTEWRQLRGRSYSFDVFLDVRDAMGANLMNTVLEELAPLIEDRLGASCLFAVVSNDGLHRCYRAECSLSFRNLSFVGRPGVEVANRVLRAADLADIDASRAVTHNKGIMNGITALALATGNDTRALEASVHAYAGRGDGYRALSRYRIEGETLHAELSLPLFLATKGGSTEAHPVAGWSKRVLSSCIDVPLSADLLGRVAVSVGLAQNFAALLALTGGGIQKGHMALHRRKKTSGG